MIGMVLCGTSVKKLVSCRASPRWCRWYLTVPQMTFMVPNRTNCRQLSMEEKMIQRLLVAASLYGAALAAGNAADLAVTVNGMKDGTGFVIATIFDGEKNFLNRP